VRVAFATPATFEQARGGGERYVHNLARGLVRASPDVQVEIITPAVHDQRHPIEDRVTLCGLRCDVQNAEYGDGLSWQLAGALADVDIVHVHQVFTHYGEAATLAARIFGRPLCVTDHGAWASQAGQRFGILQLAGAVVGYSRFGLGLLGDPPNAVIIEGGIDTDFFRPAEEPSPREHALFVGRIMPHKGIDLLIRHCPEHVPVVVAGTPSNDAYLRDLRALAAGRAVRFEIDPTDAEIRELYRRAIAVVVPSVYVDMYGATYKQPELMGLSMLEGMACGAPAICLRTGGLPEYVDDAETGYVVDTGAQLAARLSQLADDRSLVKSLGMRARERVRSEWDMAVAGGRLLSLYRNLMNA
jgi:glycosyltransferase involved in cell wall biosynthesis